MDGLMNSTTDQIQAYEPQDVFKTAAKYVEHHQAGMGNGLTHGINQVCICCKAGSTADGQVIGHVDRIIDAHDLKPWTNFYTSGKNEFQAYKCRSCGYQWSWYRTKQTEVN